MINLQGKDIVIKRKSYVTVRTISNDSE